MNIFVLSEDPIVAARMQCNKHVVKMVLESTQMLCNALPEESSPYERCHYNNPCSKWVRASVTNYKWLLVHAIELCEEYTRRYKKEHACERILYGSCLEHPQLPDVGLTPFVRNIKDPWKVQSNHMSIVDAYRFYYLGDKARFARWMPRASAPEWWPRKDT